MQDQINALIQAAVADYNRMDWSAPARNHARGNVLDGGYVVQWTGPLYCK